jgi:hypothetical protein
MDSLQVGTVAFVVVVEAVVFLVAVIWSWQLAQRIQLQDTEIKMLKQQLTRLANRQITIMETTEAEITQRDDALKDFASERY